MNAMERYIDFVVGCFAKLNENPSPVKHTARAVYDALHKGGFLYTFGTGHSHMLAEEIFYRAGGLARIKPILVPELMLHVSATGSTEAERRTGLFHAIAEEYGLSENDIILIASNSGRNSAAIELALEAKTRGTQVIALTSLAHSNSEASRHPSGKRLFELADIVLDNLGVPGDACLEIGSQKVSPTSTVVGACILQSIVAEVVTIGVAEGHPIETFSSSNVTGGDEHNARLLEKYAGLIKSL